MVTNDVQMLAVPPLFLPQKTTNMINTNIHDYEIMAPVGSRESLQAAIQAGADSIYFGVEQLNMRSHSANHFTIEDLHEIAAICTEHSMKSYLTVNTIIYDEDVELMHQIIDAAKEANISAATHPQSAPRGDAHHRAPHYRRHTAETLCISGARHRSGTAQGVVRP